MTHDNKPTFRNERDGTQEIDTVWFCLCERRTSHWPLPFSAGQAPPNPAFRTGITRSSLRFSHSGLVLTNAIFGSNKSGRCVMSNR